MFRVVYVRINELVTQQDANCSAKLQEVAGIVRIEHELVLSVAGIDRVLFIRLNGGDLCRGRGNRLFTFRNSFDDL